MIVSRFATALLAILASGLVGCGGKGGSSPTKATPKIAIAWPARSRDVSAPGSAEAASVVLTVPGALSGTNFFTVERPAGSAASTQTYAFPTPVKPGAYEFVLRFSVGTDAASAVVAKADVMVQVDRSGALLDLEGKPITTAVLEGQIASVDLPTGQTVDLGTTATIPVQATTKDGSLFAANPGAVAFRVASGTALSVNADGSLTGKAEGEATLIATVDGVDSAPQTVRVGPAPVASRLVGPVPRDLVVDPVRGRLLATASDASGGVVDEIDPVSGTVTRSFAVGDAPDVLGLADDASTLYVGLPKAGTILPLDLAAGTPGTPIALPMNAYGTGYHAVQLAVRPGHPETLVAISRFADLGGELSLDAFDAGVPRPSFLSGIACTFVAWESPTRLFCQTFGYPSEILRETFDSGSSNGGYVRYNVLGPTNLGFTLSGVKLYANDLSVFDTNLLQTLGRFADSPEPSSGTRTYGPAIDEQARLAFFVVKDSTEARLYTYRTDDLSLYATRRIVDFPVAASADLYNTPHLLRWGAKGLALATPKGILLIDDAPGL